MTLKRETGNLNSNSGDEIGKSNTDDDKSQRLQTLRAKRQSNAHESNLPKIQETEEGRRDEMTEDEDDAVFEETPMVRTSRWKTSSFSFFQTEIDQDSSESGQSLKDSNEGLEQTSLTHERIITSEDISVKSEPNRQKNESRIAYAGDIESTQTSETNRTKNTSHTRLHSCSESSKSSLGSIPKLDVRNTNSFNKSNSDSQDEKSCHSKKSNVSNEIKLPHVKSVQSSDNIGQDGTERLYKSVKFRADKESSMLSGVGDDVNRHVNTEANKLLLDIVYPHEFYDRYSRARNSRKTSVNQAIQKEAISICKPAKVNRKVNQSEKTWNRLPQSTVKVPEEGGAVLQYSSTPEKKRKQEHTDNDSDAIKKDIHIQCKPKMNALVITDSMRGQKMVLKGLKGWLLRKHDECKSQMNKDTKQSLYQVSTLGMKFGLPEYNQSLHDRKPTSPRPVTCITTRSQDPGVILRPNTHNLGPRQRTMPVFTRDLLPGQSRGFGALQRDLTNIPSRLPSSVQESSSKNTVQVQNNSSPKYLEHAIAKVMKVGLSLPPITTEVKSPTVTIGHTQT